MSTVLNNNLFAQPVLAAAGTAGTTSNVSATLAGTVGLTSGTGVAGSSATNPYLMPPNTTNVPFGMGSQPQYVANSTGTYQFDTTKDGSLIYKSTTTPGQTLTLSYTGSTTPNSTVTGYERYREEAGTETVQVGTEKYVTGYKQVQTGTEKVQTGTESYTSGTEKVLTGYEQVQTGTEKYKTGTEQVLTGYKDVQTGTEQYISSYKDVQTGTTQVPNGTEQYIKGYEQVQTGTTKVQVGTEQYQTGTEQVLVRTDKVQTGTQVTGFNTRVETGSITVNRELDARANGGAVGDILDQGTGLLLDANKANSFFTTNAGQYKLSSLTGEDNQTNGETVDIFKKTDADDMYVAGDPIVGGKGNNYKPEEITPGTGFLTMYEDGTATGRKVTVNAHVDQINTEGNRAFTEYGWVIQDDAGVKTTAKLSAGQLMINGQQLLPGQEKVIGDPANPVAKFYYASMPGGQNGTNEQRLVFESYEKVTPETRQKLIDAGANASEVDNLSSTFKASFGFRIPDGKGSYRAPEGVAGGLASSNGIKTYYDAHFHEPPSFELTTRKEYKDPIYEPVYTDKPVYETRPTYGTRPVYEDRPTYEQKPIYGERQLYKDQPIYEKQPVYATRPVYGKQPVYETRDVYGDRPVYTQKPIYEDKVTYGTRPIYEDRPTYGQEPVYGERPIYKTQPVYRDVEKPLYGNDYGVKISYDTPTYYPPVAPKEHARIWGDPHIDEADGGKYDFNERGVHSVLQDQNLSLNAKLDQGPGKTTVITQSGLVIGARTVDIRPDGSAVIGFSDPTIKAAAITLANGQTFQLDDKSTITRNGVKINVDSPEYKIMFDTDVYKGFKYLNIDVWSKEGGVMLDNVAPTGLLGETFDADATKQTKIKLDKTAYKQGTLFTLPSQAAPVAQPLSVVTLPTAVPPTPVYTTPAPTPVYNTPAPAPTPTPVYTPPAPTPVYTPPVVSTPPQTDVSTPPVAPTPVYTPPVPPTPVYKAPATPQADQTVPATPAPVYAKPTPTPVYKPVASTVTSDAQAPVNRFYQPVQPPFGFYNNPVQQQQAQRPAFQMPQFFMNFLQMMMRFLFSFNR